MVELFDDKTFYKRLVKLAVPIALQALLLACVGESDTIMLGSLEQTAMSAVSLATQIQFIQNIIVMGALSAFLILGAQYHGKGDKRNYSNFMLNVYTPGSFFDKIIRRTLHHYNKGYWLKDLTR